MPASISGVGCLGYVGVMDKNDALWLLIGVYSYYFMSKEKDRLTNWLC